MSTMGSEECDVQSESLHEELLANTNLNPKVRAAIRSIQSEKLGLDPIEWGDFSSHNQS